MISFTIFDFYKQTRKIAVAIFHNMLSVKCIDAIALSTASVKLSKYSATRLNPG
jgi:hypothetical protein